MTGISACVIVRDEEKNLPTWLESVRSLADEMVVVDTGSEDSSVAIAEKGGARVEHFPWVDDFSAAKNYALDCCHGDWVIMLDADEYFSPEDLPKIWRLVERYRMDRSVLGFFFQRINIDRDNFGSYLSSGPQIRFFRRLPELRYHGRIHENLSYEGKGEGKMLFSDEATIYHTGYSSGVIREKHLRNLALLKREEEEGRGEGKEFYLADCYYGLRDYGKAAEYARKGIESGFSVAVGDDCRPYQLWIEGLMLTGGTREEILYAVERAKKAHPEAARFDFLSGLDAWDRKDYLTAEAEFRRGVGILEGRKEELSPLGGTGQAKYFGDACGKLALISHWRKKEEEALLWCYRGLAAEKYNARVFQLWMKLLKDLPDLDLIELLNGIYDKKGDAPFLVRNLNLPSQRKVNLYYRKQALMGSNEFESYWLGGKTLAAAAAAAEDMDALCRLGLCLANSDGKKKLLYSMPECYRESLSGKPVTPRVARLRRSLEREKEGMRQ